MTPIPTNQFSISDKAFRKDASRRENLHALRDAGFSHIHFSYEWRSDQPVDDQAITQWHADLKAAGMRVLDVHGIHPGGMLYNLWSDTTDARAVAVDLFKHRLQLTRELGGDAMVYHVPCHVEAAPEVYDRFIDSLAGLEDYALGLGVAVALENHYQLGHDRAALTRAFAAFSPEFIALTLDPGHAQMSGNLDWLLEHCRGRLRILHLNDNDRTTDRHWNPFFHAGTVDWQAVIAAIADSPYSKPIQLEVCWRPEQHRDHQEFLREAHSAALRVAEAVNRKRQARARACAVAGPVGRSGIPG